MVLLHGVLMNGTLWDEVVGGLRDRYRFIVPELPFGAHTLPMPDDADLSLASRATLIAVRGTRLWVHCGLPFRLVSPQTVRWKQFPPFSCCSLAVNDPQVAHTAAPATTTTSHPPHCPATNPQAAATTSVDARKTR